MLEERPERGVDRSKINRFFPECSCGYTLWGLWETLRMERTEMDR